jgi:tyrosinase
VGIPTLYRRETLSDGSPNPLHHQPIPPNISGSDDQPAVTSRDPRDPTQLPTRADVQDVVDAGDFRDFNNRLENLHNWVHVWVGGTMSDVAYAAYDPLFWAHHAMVDRIWRLWQLQHAGIGSIDGDILDTVLQPFPMTVRMTLDVADLGYEYAATSSSATLTTSEGAS